VPLSEHEQRLLEQMERALYAEDPKFASSLRSAGPRPGSRRQAALGVLVALGGLAVLVLGAASSLIPVGVLGFVMMLIGTYTVVRSMRATTTVQNPPTAAAPPSSPNSGFMDRMDERFRRRREGDDPGL
jgi:hypothetical protein